ncbi:MAG: rhomboid family intramembrane serine protease [Flavobacteriia bacterium]|jgi:membrane associated rhomboid family serine protease|nr:rhomboid family intramembrane serine protease [Cryomorphaceae bacterium]
MSLSVLLILIVITVIVSMSAFNNNQLTNRLLYSPYSCKHDGDYFRMFGHMFIHADTMHLLFNMMSLFFLGSLLEDELMFTYGKVRGEVHFLLIYILGGLFATLIPYIRHQDNPSYRSLGASGAVSAVIFAAILWNPKMELMIMFLPIPIPAYIFGPLYIAFEYWADRRGGTGIAHDAHIGGAIFGILYVLIINIDKGKEFLSALFG